MRGHRLDQKGIHDSAPDFRALHLRNNPTTHHAIALANPRRIMQITRHLHSIGDILPAVISLCKSPAARRQRTHDLRELIECALALSIDLILLLTHLVALYRESASEDSIATTPPLGTSPVYSKDGQRPGSIQPRTTDTQRLRLALKKLARSGFVDSCLIVSMSNV